MAINSNSEDGRTLRNTIPLSTFPLSAFEELCKTARVEQVQDSAVFKRGDTDEFLVYLLKGKVSLESDGLYVENIEAGSDSARFALAHQIPRKIDAVAKGAVRIVRLDPGVVNNPPEYEGMENQGVTVVEESDPDDWMTALLQLPLFQILPATCLQKILTTMKTEPFGRGDQIIDSSKKIDRFFIIAKGECLLQSEYGEVKLVPGDSFGEAYAHADYSVKETVMALTDGSVITLERNHFHNAVIKPLIKHIKLEEVPDWLSKDAFLLDVRSSHNYARHHMEGSVNIPLLGLGRRIAELPADKKIIVICANGKASEAAAFILFKHGLDALVVKSGMAIYESEEPEKTDTATQGMSAQEPETVVKEQLENITGQGNELFDVQADTFEAGLHALKSENERLVSRNLELEEINSRLSEEKAKLIQENQTLTQHLNRLKEILNRFNKR
jgi:rhodanese-related sulfurtransferase